MLITRIEGGMVKTKENLSGGGLSRRGSCLLAAVSRNDDFSDGFFHAFKYSVSGSLIVPVDEMKIAH